MSQISTPLLDDDGAVRMHRFVIATIVSAIIIAIGVTFGVHAADTGGGWGVAVGVGAMTGFWMSPLAGALIGNGYHEIMKDRAEAEAEAVGAESASHRVDA